MCQVLIKDKMKPTQACASIIAQLTWSCMLSKRKGNTKINKTTCEYVCTSLHVHAHAS